MRTCLSFLCLWLCLSALGEDAILPFGEVGRHDLLMKTCAFDPNAAVVYLIDEGKSIISPSLEVVTERRIRIKILKESGIREASVKLFYRSKDQYEELDDVQGFTYQSGCIGQYKGIAAEPSRSFT